MDHTPWKISNNEIEYEIVDNKGSVVLHYFHKADGAFILQAINCHAELLGTLEKIDKWITDEQIRGRPPTKPTRDIQDAARAAVIKAARNE